MKILINRIFILFILCASLLSCSNVNRALITDINGDPKSDTGAKFDLSQFFVMNGFEKKPWNYSGMFGPVDKQDVNQRVLSYWQKIFIGSFLGPSKGVIQAWEVLEDDQLIVYVVGTQNHQSEAEEIVVNLSRSISLYDRNIVVVHEKVKFFDFR